MKEIGDFGPIYTETDLSQFPVEPFNTFSNLFFLAVIVYWFLKIKKISDANFRRFLYISLPILLVGYVGGTIYHATRSHDIWLIMDFGPIFILAILVSFYMWKKIVKSYWKTVVYIAVLVSLPRLFLFFFAWNSSARITLGYAFLSLPILLPMFLYEKSRKWLGRRDLMLCIAFLLVALFFRSIDSSDFVRTNVPIGTHWLWHSFGGITTHLVLTYLHRHTLSK